MNTIYKQDLLTRREWEIITLIAKSYTDRMIVYELKISYNTVTTHRKHILDKVKELNPSGVKVKNTFEKQRNTNMITAKGKENLKTLICSSTLYRKMSE